MHCQGMYCVIYCVTFSHQDKKPLLEEIMQLVGSIQEEKYFVAREVQKIKLYDPKDWICPQVCS